MPTKYASSQDWFNARRDFHLNFYEGLLKEGAVNKHRLFIELSVNHAITEKNFDDIIRYYLAAHLLKIQDDEVIRIG